ncbi:MAG: hypothetical protein UR25_C0001G0016 [Candidatus Nomurabacteria bacterium GW2011_GWE1_32_28]|uniref:DUF2914 domain-containing protein n=1 Tax=Candidatus Nomurabacteria bacterium GW2011_GWF1_31_48 TaxID=1618767 RepID=A0A0F9YE39_9BACT|nr:MAG: hypothetical protein UR10_C0005G0032 [Candidatus Nomurabacteria bacterium GW2011_GWF2_30_133]KKP28384.1 MAG: hypothetical protein UR18_C0005G0032 [Candidatus Nomurabacteria bacterium GW2011_GWE2_31_40]KKP29969.1 MAG: hypothetical protein UR19_C0006G0032 [Candidatus Nomurabacteria bacterium GW2011_GWF1_31_48]KKP35104.1 MAG: hypothetical protein UR25_C0001G0016 [Candidatus Nomurabacteria bacterium GW2011_GWE1_32_28]HAS80916.1 hypothetical protein [Candidatus Nomurabacteria bacterium]
MFLIEKTRNWYGRFERPISSLSLISGFIFDALTLKRLDTLWENFWILGHIIIVGFFMALIHIKEGEIGDEANPQKKHFWYVNIIQFFFGGLLSAYIVFYFRSTDIFTMWPFLLLLLVAFIANESLKRHYIRFSFQISLLFLSIYSFAIYLIPILTHKIGPQIFLLSGLSSIITITLFILTIFHFKKNKFKESKKIIIFLVTSITIFINFLYFTNLIPPIPLSLKDTGVYYSIQKNKDNNYEVTYEDSNWKNYFKLYQDFKKEPESPVYVYSAIFSPKNLNLTVSHEWQYYNEIQNKWIIKTIVSLPVIGGRDGGFRTYSKSSNLEYGKWRVNVKTLSGQIIGRIRFNLIPVDIAPILTNEIKK